MVVENLKMAFGAVLLIGIMIWTLSIFWPEMGDNILDVNATSPAAYGNFSKMYTDVPEKTTTIVTVSLAVLVIIILIGVYGYFTRVV